MVRLASDGSPNPNPNPNPNPDPNPNPNPNPNPSLGRLSSLPDANPNPAPHPNPNPNPNPAPHPNPSPNPTPHPDPHQVNLGRLSALLNASLAESAAAEHGGHVASAALAAALNCRNGLRSTPLHQVVLDSPFSAYH